jgi:6-phosphogluconolactonase
MKVRVSAISLLSVWFALGCGASTGCPHNPAPPETSTTAPSTSSATAATTIAAPAAAPAPAVTPAPVPLEHIYVGSGDWGTATGAVTVYNYDAATGKVAQASRVDAGGLLSFLAADSKHQFLYAADEEQKKLRSFAIDANDGSLTAVATTDMLAGPVYVNLPHNDAFVLAAEFNSGKTEVFPLDGKGGFGKRAAVADSGKESHGAFLSPDDRFAFVPGRGSDQVRVFAFSAEKGTLTPQSPVKLPKGAGCRHLDFHPSGQFVYLVNEFANTVVAFSYDTAKGKLTEVQTISTTPDEGVKSSAADVHVHPSGKFLYVTNRPAGTNGSIVAYAIGADGKLTFLQKESTDGQVPRNFHLVADGTRILVGNQESKSIASFAVDPNTGALTKQAVNPVDIKPFFVSNL